MSAPAQSLPRFKLEGPCRTGGLLSESRRDRAAQPAEMPRSSSFYRSVSSASSMASSWLVDSPRVQAAWNAFGSKASRALASHSTRRRSVTGQVCVPLIARSRAAPPASQMHRLAWPSVMARWASASRASGMPNRSPTSRMPAQAPPQVDVRRWGSPWPMASFPT